MRHLTWAALLTCLLASPAARAQSSAAPSSAAPSRRAPDVKAPAPVEAAPTTGACPYGMKKSGDTDGRCCWPGQVFDGTRCVGIPISCEAFYEVDADGEACRLTPCPTGQARAKNGLNCCWPGQAWSTEQNVCKGKPRCPEPFTASGETCVGEGATATGGGGPEMVVIPAGTFTMGATANDDEKPPHLVTLNGFSIDRTEVTVSAYAACVNAGRCTTPDTTTYCNWGNASKGTHPVNCVDWNQATAFCAFADKRLPTEAEWEYVARGNDGRAYPWGNDSPSNQLCWNGEGSDLGKGNRKSTCPVSSYPRGASPFGLADMAGNVWEWVADYYGPYDGNNRANPRGPPSGERRVLRGGGWGFDSPDVVRAAYRNGISPGYRGNSLGFRCARGAVP